MAAVPSVELLRARHLHKRTTGVAPRVCPLTLRWPRGTDQIIRAATAAAAPMRFFVAVFILVTLAAAEAGIHIGRNSS